MKPGDKATLPYSCIVQCIPLIQWNSSITDTIGEQHFVPYSEVSLTQGFLVYSGRSGMRNWAEHNVAAFSELSFAIHWQGRLSRG